MTIQHSQSAFLWVFNVNWNDGGTIWFVFVFVVEDSELRKQITKFLLFKLSCLDLWTLM